MRRYSAAFFLAVVHLWAVGARAAPPVVLNGQEVLSVTPIQPNGQLAPINEQTTTGAIAALAGSGIVAVPGGSPGQVQYNNGGTTTGGLTNAQLTALIQAATISLPGAIPAGGATHQAWDPVDGWWSPSSGSGSGVTQLTGDVTIPAGSSGSAVATLASVGTAGIYDFVTTDAKGRVISGQPAFQTLTYAATITENTALGVTATVTLTGSPTFSCPTNMVAGASYQTRFVQDATGSRAATFPSCFKWPGGTPGVLSTAAGAVDVITFTSFDGSTADVVISKAFQ